MTSLEGAGFNPTPMGGVRNLNPGMMTFAYCKVIISCTNMGGFWLGLKKLNARLVLSCHVTMWVSRFAC